MALTMTLSGKFGGSSTYTVEYVSFFTKVDADGTHTTSVEMKNVVEVKEKNNG